MNKTIFEQLNIKWILLIGFIVHLPMLRNGFTYYSDDTYVLNNILVHQLNGATISTLFSTYFDGHYHPLTLLSLAFTYFFSGTNALGYQLTNLAFHLLSCWLIYKILVKLEIRQAIVLLSTLIFAVHPLNVESVARITERKDTQYVLFLLLAVYYFIEFCQNENTRKFYLIAVGCFILSLLSKGQAVIFPLLLYAISWYRYKTSGQKINHKFIAPLFILSIFFAYLNYRAQIVTGYLSETEAITIKQVIAYPSMIICSYIYKLFLPFNLSAQYPIPEVGPYFIIYTLCVLVMAAGVFLLWRKKKYLALLGVLFYVISVFPMLRIVPVSENFMPDRYNYLGLLGFGIFIAAIYAELAEKYKKFNLQYVALAWLLVISALCYKRTMIWKEGFTIWEDAYEKFPEDGFAARNYGAFLVSEKRDVNKGLLLYQKSIALAPRDMMAKINYIGALTSLGKKEEKQAALEDLINSKPVTSADLSNQAAILLQYGRWQESAAGFDKAIALKPELAKNRTNRAAYYLNRFLFDKALAELDTAESLHSNYIDMICLIRTNIYINQNKADAARKELKRLHSLGADPKQIAALRQKADVLDQLVSDDVLKKMSKEDKINYAKNLYSKGLTFQSLAIVTDLLNEDPENEVLINFAMACSFSLSRPDLVQKYVGELKKNNYKPDANALNYLASLGLSS